jgi:hypothetical protein
LDMILTRRSSTVSWKWMTRATLFEKTKRGPVSKASLLQVMYTTIDTDRQLLLQVLDVWQLLMWKNGLLKKRHKENNRKYQNQSIFMKENSSNDMIK